MCVDLAYLEDQSTASVAEALGCTRKIVKNRLREVRRELRSLIDTSLENVKWTIKRDVTNEEARMRRLLQHAAQDIGGSQTYRPGKSSVPAVAAPPPWLRSPSSLLPRAPGRDSPFGGQRRPFRPEACISASLPTDRLSSSRAKALYHWATR